MIDIAKIPAVMDDGAKACQRASAPRISRDAKLAGMFSFAYFSFAPKEK